MREFTKAFLSYSLAISLFSLKQAASLLTPERGESKGSACKALDSVTNAAINQFGETLNSTFHMLDNIQRGLISLTFSLFLPTGGSESLKAEAERGRGGIPWNSEPQRWTDIMPDTPGREVTSVPVFEQYEEERLVRMSGPKR